MYAAKLVFEPESKADQFACTLVERAVKAWREPYLGVNAGLSIKRQICLYQHFSLPTVETSDPFLLTQNVGGDSQHIVVVKVMIEVQIAAYAPVSWQVSSSAVPELMEYRKLAWYGEPVVREIVPIGHPLPEEPTNFQISALASEIGKAWYLARNEADYVQPKMYNRSDTLI